jgi:hypothetical protein
MGYKKQKLSCMLNEVLTLAQVLGSIIIGFFNTLFVVMSNMYDGVYLNLM